MSPIEEIELLAKYNQWMNAKLFRVAASIPEEQRNRDVGAFFGSILGTLNHIYLVDVTWMRRFTEDKERFAFRNASGAKVRLSEANQILYPDFDAFKRARETLDAEIVRWALDLDANEWNAEFEWRRTTGERHRHPKWWSILHFFNHQTHHRGQVTTLLSQQGRDPGVTDFGIFVTEREQAG